ncbi:MAG: hypothetical protein P1P87_12575 [Trueperaceae bacterium]|nr:hypothetical protein [Trueperaceae bacterium]
MPRPVVITGCSSGIGLATASLLAAQAPALRSAPLPLHTLENVGDEDVRVASVELKEPG